MSGLYINEISFVQFKVNWGVCRCRLYCRRCGKWIREYFSYLLRKICCF